MAHKITFRALPILFSLLLLVSCGGGGGSSSPGTTGSLSLSQGVAVDPYIVGAVFQEVAADGTVLQRQSSPSDQSGVFTFPAPLTAGSTVELKISDKGLHGGAPYKGMLRRTVGAGDTEPLVVSPMTTVLANGATAANLLQALSDSGIPGLTTADLYADPMAGLEDMTSGVTDQALAPLQAAMAIDAYMEVTNNFTAGSNELTDSSQFEIFRSMVQAQQQMLSAAEFSRISSALNNDPAVTSPMTLGDLIRTAVQEQQTLIEQVRNDMQMTGSFNPTVVDQTVQNNMEQSVTMAKANYLLRVPPLGAPDGATLYADNCAACHGAIDVSTKAGKTAADIQSAIDANMGGMSSFSSLTSMEIQAIADALATATPTTPPTTVDGLTLYNDNCAGCHGAIDVTTKAGRTAADIQAAIDANTGGMGVLSSLTAAEIQAIADVLPPAPAGSPTTPPDGVALYNSECSGCHGTLDVTTKAGRTAADIQAAIDNNTGGMGALSTLTAAEIQAIADVLPPAPPPTTAPLDGATLYANNCASCHGALDVTTKAGKTATDIQNAISNNTGGMGFLSSLTADEIQAIADVLPPAPPPTTAPLDGATLYTNNCSGCHGALDVTTKAGKTAQDIQTAISNNTGGMGFLSTLTADEIQAIADVLPAASAGTPDYSDCTACHGQPPSGDTFPNTAGAHAVHVVLPSINSDCSVCHSGASHNSQVEVVIQAGFDAKSGATVYNGDGTCSNVSCHGGQTTPVWWTGTIAVDTQCSACHAAGTSQYNSYYSGRHSLHLSQGFACTVCHNTSTLQNGHFSNLVTPTFEQSPSSTIGGGSTRVGSYVNGTCSSVACHGTHTW